MSRICGNFTDISGFCTLYLRQLKTSSNREQRDTFLTLPNEETFYAGVEARPPPPPPTVETLVTGSGRKCGAPPLLPTSRYRVRVDPRGLIRRELAWPNTTSAWAGWNRFDIPVDRYDGVQSLLICTSSTLESPTCH
jgi:hypothetical protein